MKLSPKFQVIDEFTDVTTHLATLCPDLADALEYYTTSFANGVDALFEEGHSMSPEELSAWRAEETCRMYQLCWRHNLYVQQHSVN